MSSHRCSRLKNFFCYVGLSVLFVMTPCVISHIYVWAHHSTSQSSSVEASGIGLLPVSSGCDNSTRRGDVIFVHGLAGDARGTWYPEGQQESNSFWLTWIGEERPDLCVWTFGYEAARLKWSGSAMPLVDLGAYLLKTLEIYNLGKRPLVFISHSMGGLIVKEMLRTSETFNRDDIVNSTKGVVFLSTPHTGSHLASLIGNIGPLLGTTVNVEELKLGTSQLRKLNEWFRENVKRLKISVEIYYETKPIHRILVVNADSNDPGIEGIMPVPLPEDHNSIAKPKSKKSLVYLGVQRFIKLLIP